ncbi:hypothetical protein ACIRLA_28760 [Streptomyces sp. NPDC102364]|uniref:hypothetical protein n=1 Tax=Streptomyces sp. NPDC102364 TaxID=3366161 RepID=UPI0037F76CC3
MFNAALTALLGDVQEGDYVTAVGVDTRGADVERVGTVLAPPKPMKGKGGAGIRLCVGLKGASPDERSTWTMLYEGQGYVQQTKPPVPGEDWTNGPLKDVPGMRVNAPMHIFFGGKGGKRSTAPVTEGRAEIVHVGDGRYEVRSLVSGAVFFSGAWGAQIWWSPAAENGEPYYREQDHDEHQEQDKPQDQAVTEQRFGKAVYHVRTGALVGYVTLAKFTPIEEAD